MTQGSSAAWARQAGVPADSVRQYPGYESSSRSAWAGWILFAGSMLMLLGGFQVMAGLVALLNQDIYLVSSKDLVIHMDYTVYGWIHIILGALAALTGAAMMFGQTWARVVGVGIAFLSALSALGFLGASPVWSVLIIAFDVVVIYALCVHGRELKDAG